MENNYNFSEITKVLKSGGTILYPTDTIWGIGCDATNAKAVEKIYRIKVRDVGKSLIILVDSLDTLKKYVEEVPDNAVEMILSYSDPLTIIYPKAKNLPKNVIANDGSIAIRIPNDDFCCQLIRDFGKPITSTSANISGDPSPLTFAQISGKIVGMVDHVVSIKQQSLRLPKPSAIIKVDLKGNIQIIRS
jgi:L-threonylcarbamoyladenylate synthase